MAFRILTLRAKSYNPVTSTKTYWACSGMADPCEGHDDNTKDIVYRPHLRSMGRRLGYMSSNLARNCMAMVCDHNNKCHLKDQTNLKLIAGGNNVP